MKIIVKLSKVLKFLFAKGFFYWLDDEKYIQILYNLKLGKKVDLKNPKTFNEKIQWLKLNYRKHDYTVMVDKYAVKEYVSSVIGAQYIVPVLGVWDRFEEIDFSKFPRQFVLKTTHDSGTVVIVKDKDNLNIKDVKKQIKNSLKKNYFYKFREWPYKFVKPRIIAEKYISDLNSDELSDYKFYCFNGVPKLLLIATGRNSKEGVKMNFFDMDFNKLNFHRGHPTSNEEFQQPKNFEKMKEFSKILSKNIPFIRCDFYESNENLYFGELTFYPAAGFEPFEPEEWDLILGEMLVLPI